MLSWSLDKVSFKNKWDGDDHSCKIVLADTNLSYRAKKYGSVSVLVLATVLIMCLFALAYRTEDTLAGVFTPLGTVGAVASGIIVIVTLAGIVGNLFRDSASVVIVSDKDKELADLKAEVLEALTNYLGADTNSNHKTLKNLMGEYWSRQSKLHMESEIDQIKRLKGDKDD